MACLAVYDMVGIQQYVFSSNKVKEIIGASALVQKALDTFLVESLDANGVDCEWERADAPVDSPKGTVLYIGGGNALVSFVDKAQAITATQAFSKKLLNKTGGGLHFAVAYHEKKEEETFAEAFIALFRTLEENKFGMTRSNPLGGIAITQQGATDGLPATYIENGEALSTQAKRKTDANDATYYKHLLEGSDKAFPLEFDKLGFTEGDGWIAVVHIDGNNMGKLFKDQMEHETDFGQAVTGIRALSCQVRNTYREVFSDMLLYLEDRLEHDKELCKRFKLKRGTLPIRPIILNGDDVTFVCEGHLGIALAVDFLQRIGKRTLGTGDLEQNASACAGVCLIKPHYPFWRGCQIAEELCHSAKMHSKIEAEDAAPGSWLDVHVQFSGMVDSLERVRTDWYQVPGMAEPEAREYGSKQIKRYNLLARPWNISGPKGKGMEWREFDNMFCSMTKSEERWPRSRLKQLRHAFSISEEAATEYVRECESRDKKLPKVGKWNGKEPFTNGITPYFDCIELLDYYVALAEKGDEQ